MTPARFAFGVDMEGVQLACFQVEALVERAGLRTGPMRNHVVVLERPRAFTTPSLRQHAPRIIADCPLLVLFECKQGSSSKHQCAIPLSDITELHKKYLLRGQGRVTTKGLTIIVTAGDTEELAKFFTFVSDRLADKALGAAICCGGCKNAAMSRVPKKRSRGKENDENPVKLRKTKVTMGQVWKPVEEKRRCDDEVRYEEGDRELGDEVLKEEDRKKMEEEASVHIAAVKEEEERRKKREAEASARIAAMKEEEERKKRAAEASARIAAMKEEEERKKREAEASARIAARKEEEERRKKREAEASARIAAMKEEEERKSRAAEASARIAAMKEERQKQEEERRRQRQVDEQMKLKTSSSGFKPTVFEARSWIEDILTPAEKELLRKCEGLRKRLDMLRREDDAQRRLGEERCADSDGEAQHDDIHPAPQEPQETGRTAAQGEKQLKKAAERRQARIEKEAAKLAASKEKAQKREELKRWKEEQKRKLEESKMQKKREEYMRHLQRPTCPPQFYVIPDEIRGWNYPQYEERWAQLRSPSNDSPLNCFDIPWPPAGNPLFLLRGDTPEVQKRKLRTALLRWHPDKFHVACGKRLLVCDRDMILAQVERVVHNIMLWKAWLSAPPASA